MLARKIAIDVMPNASVKNCFHCPGKAAIQGNTRQGGKKGVDWGTEERAYRGRRGPFEMGGTQS